MPARQNDATQELGISHAVQAPVLSHRSAPVESPLILEAYKLLVGAATDGASEECCQHLLDGLYKMLVNIGRAHDQELVGLGAMARDMAEVRRRLGTTS